MVRDTVLRTMGTDVPAASYNRSRQMEKRYLSEVCLPDSASGAAARKDLNWRTQRTLPAFSIRVVDLTEEWGL